MKYRPLHWFLPVDSIIFKKVLSLALPIILGNLSRVLMGVVEMIIAWGFFLPACYITAVKMEAGILGSWISFGLYLLFYAIAVTWKVLQGDWKEIKV